MTIATDNPLLTPSTLPAFDRVEVKHMEQGIPALLAELTAELDALEAHPGTGWSDLVEPLERIGERLSQPWGMVGHLMSVKNSDALRAAHESLQPDVVKFGIRFGQSEPIFRALEALAAGPEWSKLDAGQRRIVDNLLRDARLAGVALEGESRERFNAVQLELSELSTRFSNNVLDATKAFSMTLTKPEEVEGLPKSALSLYSQSAVAAGSESSTPEQGPWRVTLDHPSLLPFLQHARNRELRERLYRAFVTRASSDDLDNTPLIERIITLRAEMAQLLGFGSYAELSIATKMAPGVDAVFELLEELRSASFDAAKTDHAEIEELARSRGELPEGGLAHWDVAYWSERLSEERFTYTAEELRPYFPLPHVLNGLFELSHRLFGLRVEAADGEAPVWHPDVRYFRIFDAETDAEIASFFLDAYSRPGEKRGGAWMDECRGRTALDAPEGQPHQLPVAYLCCNGTPPVGDQPSLMTFGEVNTLFHEFGHGLQHMLTEVDYGLASGIRNVDWDAVELPSQFMENWCYHRETLLGLTSHVETGEPLPDELFRKLESARHFRAGSSMLRQLFFGTTDLELHHRYQASDGGDPFAVQRAIAERTAVLQPLPEDRSLCAFGHIFGGGYAAGYYSYKWAEVLSADAFAAFEEAGLDDESAVGETGRRYRKTVLALGGSLPPMEVFEAFRGRKPTTAALLRHSGLAS